MKETSCPSKTTKRARRGGLKQGGRRFAWEVNNVKAADRERDVGMTKPTTLVGAEKCRQERAALHCARVRKSEALCLLVVFLLTVWDENGFLFPSREAEAVVLDLLLFPFLRSGTIVNTPA